VDKLNSDDVAAGMLPLGDGDYGHGAGDGAVLGDPSGGDAGGDGGGDRGDGGAQNAAEDDRRKEDSKHRFLGAKWLFNSGPQSRLVLIRQVLGPLVSIMGKYIGKAGLNNDKLVEFRKLQKLSGIDVDVECDVFTVIAASKFVLEDEFFNALKDIMTTESFWAVTPPSYRLHSLRTEAFVMLSQIGCLCHELKTLHGGYPFKMFTLLDGNCGDILGECDDMKDRWSKALIAKYAESKDGLLDPDLKAELTHAAFLLKRETVSIEASHAAIRRSLCALSVQTHSLHIKRLSALRSLQRFRTRRRRLREGWAGKVIKGAKRKGVKEKPAPSKRQFGHGGAWRAFVRQRTLGQKGSPAFKLLSQGYRELTPDEKVKLKEVGKTATRAARAGNKRPFGDKTRQLQRSYMKSIADTMVKDRTKERVITEGIAACSASGEPAIAADDGAIYMKTTSSTALADIAEVRKATRLEQQCRAEEKLHSSKAMQSWCEGAGVDSRAACLSDEAFHRLEESMPVPFPSTELKVFEWEPMDVLDRVKRGLSIHRHVIADVFAALITVWDKIHDTIDHVPKPDWDVNDDAGIPSCMEAGMCVCSGHGIDVGKIVKNFDSALKKAVPVGKVRKDVLVPGFIVGCAFGQRQPTEDEGDEVDIRTSGLVEGLPVVESKWLHEEGLVAPWARLVGTLDFTTPWQEFKEFDRNLRWSVCVYNIREKITPLGTIVPNVVEVRLQEEVEKPNVPTCRVIWKPKWAKWRKTPVRSGKKDVDFKSGWGS
ncbi:unnamed protein product, partial [Prorocentrum cordatum]